jgi:hypothetical protein
VAEREHQLHVAHIIFIFYRANVNADVRTTSNRSETTGGVLVLVQHFHVVVWRDGCSFSRGEV